MGVDPGLRVTGYGVISCDNNSYKFVDCGKISSGNGTTAERLERIYDGLVSIMAQYKDLHALAIEDVFMAKNFKSTLKLGQAHGVAILAAVKASLQIASYAPRQVKKAVTGVGSADKNQVAHMVKVLLNYRETISNDISDALAVAICHANYSQTNLKLYSGPETGSESIVS